jgi:hypothetical protein
VKADRELDETERPDRTLAPLPPSDWIGPQAPGGEPPVENVGRHHRPVREGRGGTRGEDDIRRRGPSQAHGGQLSSRIRFRADPVTSGTGAGRTGPSPGERALPINPPSVIPPTRHSTARPPHRPSSPPPFLPTHGAIHRQRHPQRPGQARRPNLAVERRNPRGRSPDHRGRAAPGNHPKGLPRSKTGPEPPEARFPGPIGGPMGFGVLAGVMM